LYVFILHSVEVQAVNKLGKDIQRTKVIIDYDFVPDENVPKKKGTEQIVPEVKMEIDEKIGIEEVTLDVTIQRMEAMADGVQGFDRRGFTDEAICNFI
jgi:hypothetical protein